MRRSANTQTCRRRCLTTRSRTSQQELARSRKICRHATSILKLRAPPLSLLSESRKGAKWRGARKKWRENRNAVGTKRQSQTRKERLKKLNASTTPGPVVSRRPAPRWTNGRAPNRLVGRSRRRNWKPPYAGRVIDLSVSSRLARFGRV